MSPRKERGLIAIDPDVLRNVKAVAAAKGMSVKTLTEQALLAWCLAQPEVRSDRKSTKPLAVRL